MADHALRLILPAVADHAGGLWVVMVVVLLAGCVWWWVDLRL